MIFLAQLWQLYNTSVDKYTSLNRFANILSRTEYERFDDHALPGHGQEKKENNWIVNRVLKNVEWNAGGWNHCDRNELFALEKLSLYRDWLSLLGQHSVLHFPIGH